MPRFESGLQPVKVAGWGIYLAFLGGVISCRFSNPLVGTKINYELPGYYKTEFQLIARAGSYEVGEALIEKAIEALTIGYGERLGNYVFRYSRPQTEPSAYPLSKGNLLEFAVDFDVAFHVHKEPEVEQQPESSATTESSQPVDAKPLVTTTAGAVSGV